MAAQLEGGKHGGDRKSDQDLISDLDRGEAASTLNVSTDSVAQAAKVRKHAPSKVVDAVKSGGMNINQAAAVADVARDESASEEDVQAAVDKALDGGSATEIKKAAKPHLAQNTGEVEWYTPEWILDGARTLMGGIELDPASCESANRIVRADRIFTKEDSGLDRIWEARSLWMNPPFARGLIDRFVDRLVQSVAHGSVSQAVMLTHNNTDTEWFHVALQATSCFALLRGRVKYWSDRGESSAPLNGAVLYFYGISTHQVQSVFGEHGIISEVNHA